MLTAAGVGVAIASLVTVLGMLDSLGKAIDVSDAQMTRADRDRVLVQPTTSWRSTTNGSRRSSATHGRHRGSRPPPPCSSHPDGEDAFDLVIDSYAFDTHCGRPRPRPTDDARPAGLILARKAAGDLHVRPGDTVRLRHPARAGTGLGS